MMNPLSAQPTLVMVHPDLKDDPLLNQGKIAMVNNERNYTHNLYLTFEDGQKAIYHPAELLMLRNKQEVFTDLSVNGTAMAIGDFKALYKIMMLQDRETFNANVAALEIARDHPGIRRRALEPPSQQRVAELNTTVNR
jgi:hypothetical protein